MGKEEAEPLMYVLTYCSRLANRCIVTFNLKRWSGPHGVKKKKKKKAPMTMWPRSPWTSLREEREEIEERPGLDTIAAVEGNEDKLVRLCQSKYRLGCIDGRLVRRGRSNNRYDSCRKTVITARTMLLSAVEGPPLP
jgi:hypothetical protein